MITHEFDVLVIGSGIAGLSYALHAAEHGEVALVTKKQRAESNTNYAQGGIAVVQDPTDSPALHVRDTLLAGAGLCRARAVADLVNDGPARVRELIAWGVQFSAGERGLSLGREGGHSRRRIVHAGDTTGREIERALLDAVAAHPRIRLCEDHHAIDLLVGDDPELDGARCVGALVLDHVTDEVRAFHGRVVMLSTGGLAQAFLHTTNPAIATGDGVAMAYRAGAAIANLEFMQFHPTALYPAGANAFLITEAVRGEGAILRTATGERLAVDPLAPRDVVARAIDASLKESGAAHALLDLTPIPVDTVERRFPAIAAECERRGLRIPRDPLPVVPAAHYACGGVVTDAHGRTTLAGLFACGEAACTGVHGANRLASNSLLEAVVYSRRAAEALPAELGRRAAVRLRGEEPTGFVRQSMSAPRDRSPQRAGLLEELRSEVRTLMWESAGIVRTRDRLRAAGARLEELHETAAAAAIAASPRPEQIELRNLVDVSRLIVRAARFRCESRGLHYVQDVPFRDNERFLRDTVMTVAQVRRTRS
jgi:L-aspartate oxidase